MSLFKRGEVWWYKFYFAGQLIRETSKSTSKTVAKDAERERRRELEAGYNNVKEIRQNRIRSLEEIIGEYLIGYRLRYRSATFAEYALGHVSRLLGSKLVVDINEAAVMRYQEDRLREKAAPKSINEEVRFLLKMMGDPGEVIRSHLKKKKQLKLPVHKRIGKAFDTQETDSLTAKAKKSRSPHMFLAFMFARNGGLRDTEIKTLTWGQINLDVKTVQVGRAKSEAGEGRIVPLNSELFAAVVNHRTWYLTKFGAIQDDWYLFPWGRPRPSDPTRHITSFKTAWKTMRKNAKVKGRWHDNRHTLITELAESGAGDETIMEIAGHVDRQMLRHYSHIRMKAKRVAMEAVIAGRRDPSQPSADQSQ
ncbi:MAG: site-specific integrase [Edaphobacter sp.]